MAKVIPLLILIPIHFELINIPIKSIESKKIVQKNHKIVIMNPIKIINFNIKTIKKSIKSFILKQCKTKLNNIRISLLVVNNNNIIK